MQKGIFVKKLNDKKEFGIDTMRTYLIIVIFLYYTLPIVFKFMGENGKAFSDMQLLALNPIVIFLVTVMYTVKVGINWKFPFILALIFIPNIFIFYDWTALVYAITYWVISFAGLALGAGVKKFLG